MFEPIRGLDCLQKQGTESNIVAYVQPVQYSTVHCIGRVIGVYRHCKKVVVRVSGMEWDRNRVYVQPVQHRIV